MKAFLQHFFHWETSAKSALGALIMGVALIYENRGNPFEMYSLALAGQLVYSFLLGNAWMSLYLTGKHKLRPTWWWRGWLVGAGTALIVFVLTWLFQFALMNPEALATARWALLLSLGAFWGNELLALWQGRRC